MNEIQKNSIAISPIPLPDACFESFPCVSFAIFVDYSSEGAIADDPVSCMVVSKNEKNWAVMVMA